MGIETSGASASVLPVTHKLKLAVGFSYASAALATTGLTDDLVSVQPVPLDLHVAITLADVIAPTPCSNTHTGSTGAEGVAPSRLTSSLEHSMLIAPTLLLTPSVQLMLHSFFT